MFKLYNNLQQVTLKKLSKIMGCGVHITLKNDFKNILVVYDNLININIKILLIFMKNKSISITYTQLNII